jgi:hypothetical protein
MTSKIKKKLSDLEEENIEEVSLGSAVGGYSEPVRGGKRGKKKMKKSLVREDEDVIEEMILRAIVYEALKKRYEGQRAKLIEQKKLTKIDENKTLRQIIKTLIHEAKKDVEITPHSSTAINLLEEMLKQILPNLETDYKTLTTKKEQRDSFRAHVVNAVSSLLETDDVNKEGGGDGEQELTNLDEEEEIEEVDIKVSDTDATADDKFIDIEGGEEIPEEEEDTFGLEGQDKTGRALAQEAFNNIEKNISETYAILHDDEDEKLFKDYLVTNLKLYFDKWERELGAVTEPTTDEYEAEKEEAAIGAETGVEPGAELGGEPPAPAGGEEVI